MSQSTDFIDCAVHPQVPQADDLRKYMDEPWHTRPFPGPQRYYYPALQGEYLKDVEQGALAGSDPALASERVFGDGRVSKAILLPLTRGLLPDVDVGSAICRGTNRWLAETWLDKDNDHGRFYAAIRINPSDPAGSVGEIEQWAAHDRFVAVGVPLQSTAPYGQRQYFPIWEAAAAHGLPIMVKLEGGSGIDYWPTAVGFPNHYIEYMALAPLNYSYHLVSLIAEGVFSRLPEVRFVFSDGGHDLLGPFVWRMDKNWLPTRNETPWVTEKPSDYVARHVRFCTRKNEGPAGVPPEKWLALSGAKDLLIYGSGYPFHYTLDPDAAVAGMSDECRRAVSSGNAEAFFKFQPVPEMA